MAVGGSRTPISTLQVPGDWRTPTNSRPAEAAARGDTPTTGLMRPGPVGINPPVIRKRGVTPIAIKADKAAIDSQIESAEIISGKMAEPTGPYVVAWYKDTGKLGQITNIVFAGHLDYYAVGEAVFYHLGDLDAGDNITITGDDNDLYGYAVDWVKTFTQSELDSETVKSLVGPTDTEVITLMTCSGDFDFDAGIYHDRLVVRAYRTT